MGRPAYEVLVMLKLPPGHPEFGATVKRPFPELSDAAPFAVTVPLEDPDIKFMERRRLAPASIGWVTSPVRVNVVPELVMVGKQEDAGLLTTVTVPARLLRF